jgi:hypothetical protein
MTAVQPQTLLSDAIGRLKDGTSMVSSASEGEGVSAEEYNCAHCGNTMKTDDPLCAVCKWCGYWAHKNCPYPCPKKPT